jgi:hypothetical protein
VRSQWGWEPGRRVISVEDPRLNKLLVREPFRYATLSEYASGSGLSVESVAGQIRPYVDRATLGLEVVGGEIFVLTAPGGRPIPPHGADVAPNLWEVLRAGAGLPEAHATWSCCRAMEKCGWKVVTDPALVRGGLGHLPSPPLLALELGQSTAPVIIHPPAQVLADPTGVLAEYERAGVAAVAVVCRGGELDSVSTAVRRWVLSHQGFACKVTVLVLEEPRMMPVLISARDAAVTPRNVDRSTLDTLNWSDLGR